jgi:hypothetical protein
MKLKLKKDGNGWVSGIYQGKGGISSLTTARYTHSFWHALALFSIKNFVHHFRIVRWNKSHK